jgi:signal transduction histidine kinase
MCLSEVPILVYYSYIPSIILSFFFGVFIITSKKRDIKSFALALISFIFSVWFILSFFSWFIMNPIAYLWIQKMLLIVLASLPLFVYFAYSLSGAKFNHYLNILLWPPIITVLAINFSKYYNLIYSLDENCQVIEESFYYVIYLLGLLYLAWFFLILLVGYFKLKNDDNTRKQIRVVMFGGMFLIAWTIILTKLQVFFGEDILMLIPAGMVVFIGMLAYAITRYKLMNIKLIAAQALVVAMIILVGTMYFIPDGLSKYVLVTITLVLSIGFGWMLVRSVKAEVQRKEELQLMSNQLANANDQLRKLDNSKSEFISIASHQLRTPITAIKGFLSLVLEGSYGKITPSQQDALNKAYTSNERLLNLVEDLLNISRIESGRMEFKFGPTKIEDICQEVADTLMIKAKDRKLYLDYKKSEFAIPELVIDGTKVREVISNMVDNALKYTEKGGVTMRVERITDKIRLTVSDTGIGIPPTELPYLFSKFSRGKDVARLNTGGTGLGLYVGQMMIEQNGGKIWAESDGAGKGSRFIIELPVKQDEELLKRWGSVS